MRVFVSVDMEGVAGVVLNEHVDMESRAWWRCRELMTAEAVAAVQGALDAAATSVLVVDAHGIHDNLLPERFDFEGVRVLQGPHTHFTMVEGIDAGFDVALFVGYHERAGGGDGVLNHTMSSTVVAGLELDGRPVGEIGVNAAVAGVHGVPVGMVTGDDRCAQEAAAILPDAVLVTVKEARDAQAAVTLPPPVACRRIRDGAREAVERARAGRLTPLPAGPSHYRLTCHTTTQAHMAAIIPGVTRTGPVTIEARDDDPLVAYRLIFAAILIADGASG